MNDTKSARPTPDDVVYSTDIHGLGHATLPGNSHELVWHKPAGARLGDVTVDDETRPCGKHFDERTFRTFAETFFGVEHPIPAWRVALIEASKAIKAAEAGAL